MSETGEGAEVPKEDKKDNPESMFNEFGELKNYQPTSNEVAITPPIIDTDDLPENAGMTPKANLSRLSALLSRSTPVDATQLKTPSEDPKSTK